jgi:hypothetical protein
LSAGDLTDIGSIQDEVGLSSGVFVEQQTDCMAIADIKTALAAVLTPREESKYMIVTVVVSPALDKTLAVLRAIDRETGEILLERTLRIAPEECTDAHRVLKVMLEQFLTGFPIEKWREKQAKKSVEVSKPPVVVLKTETAPLNWLLLIGIDSRWPTPSGDLELSVGVDAGGKRHGILGQIAFRAGWPQPLGEGRYLETTGLLSLGWRFSPNEKLAVRAELRTGALLVSGIGYEKNYRQWLVMLEAQLSFLWSAGPVRIGPEIALSPLFYKVYTESGDREDLAWIRVGLLLCIPLGKTALK